MVQTKDILWGELMFVDGILCRIISLLLALCNDCGLTILDV